MLVQASSSLWGITLRGRLGLPNRLLCRNDTLSIVDGTSTGAEEGVEEAVAAAIVLGPAKECVDCYGRLGA